MRWLDKLFKRRNASAFCDSSLQRRSLELNHSRIDTRRCSLDNTSCKPAQRDKLEHEELHTVGEIVRNDSITLAKRRLSHEHHQQADSSQQHRNDSSDSLGEEQENSAHHQHMVRWASEASISSNDSSA